VVRVLHDGMVRPIAALFGRAGQHLPEPLASLHTAIAHRSAAPSAGERLHWARGCARYFVVSGGTPSSFVIPQTTRSLPVQGMP
jgi:hypothetical protein